MKQLVENGGNLNMITEGVISPLNRAIFGENFKVVEILIGNGANVNVVDGKNWTPLNYAISKGQKDIPRS